MTGRTGRAHSPTYHVAAVIKARAALRRGPLVRPSVGPYSSGAKFFSHKTVNQLIASGEAVRVGTGVVHADHVRKNAAE